MSLFGNKHQDDKPADDTGNGDAQLFFDEYFREELRNRARWYFENIINENAKLFKADLDTTITEVNSNLKDQITSQLQEGLAQINIEMKEHATKQLDERFNEYTATMKEAQDSALKSLTDNAQSLQDQYKQLSETVQSRLGEQETALNGVIEENKARIVAMKGAQDAALEALSHSTETLRHQQEELSASLEKNVAEQKALIIDVFETNMARIIEHYLLGALGDQFDLKAQVPAIIKQMEENKQAIVDDMKL
jgi:N-methylhydantoinase A/oxoprolinase/acetone carboxylase beta subunit